jgi:outer membrane biosynthesis protein TonB
MTMRPHYGRPRPPAGHDQRPADRLLGASFTDRVMARVGDEPTPTPARVLARSLRHLALRDALAALLSAWRLAFEAPESAPRSLRASSAALFLSVIIIVGAGTSLLTSGALTFLGSNGPTPPQLDVGAAPTGPPAIESAPTPEATPAPSVEPSPTPQPTVTKEPRPASEDTAPKTRSPSTREGDDERDERDEDDRKKRETPEPREREREDDERDEDDDDD